MKICVDFNRSKPRGFYWEDAPEYTFYKLVHRSKFNVRKAIRCSAPGCNRLALIVDCHYPWHIEACRCRKHKNEDWTKWA